MKSYLPACFTIFAALNLSALANHPTPEAAIAAKVKGTSQFKRYKEQARKDLGGGAIQSVILDEGLTTAENGSYLKGDSVKKSTFMLYFQLF